MYNVQDIATMTGTNTETVKRWIRSGELKAEGGGKGKPYRIWPADYEEFADRKGYGNLSKIDDDNPIRGELLMELVEISRMEAILDKRRKTILNTLERLG